MIEEKNYYYCEDGETPVGPFSERKLSELLKKEVIAPDTWIYLDELEDWQLACDYPEFSEFSKPVQEPSGESAKVIGQKAHEFWKNKASRREPENPLDEPEHPPFDAGEPFPVQEGALAQKKEKLAQFFGGERGPEQKLKTGLFNLPEESKTPSDNLKWAKRERELQRLQNAARRVDLSKYRQGGQQDQAVNLEPIPWPIWFLTLYWRWILAWVLIIAIIIASLLFVFWPRKAMIENETSTTPIPSVIDGRAGAANLGGSIGAPLVPIPPTPLGDEPPPVPDIGAQNADADLPGNAQSSSPQQLGTVDVSAQAPEGADGPKEHYFLGRRRSVIIADGVRGFNPGTPVKVIKREKNFWTVEADGVLFQLRPDDLSQAPTPGVLTKELEVSDERQSFR